MADLEHQNTDGEFDFAVVGAGVAGIAIVGTLVDSGVRPDDLLWVDPRFGVGDLGDLWRNVPGNTKAHVLSSFLMASPSFDIQNAGDFTLTKVAAEDPDYTPVLDNFVEPLEWVTDRLREKSNSVPGRMTGMSVNSSNNLITISPANAGDEVVFGVGQTFLATGSTPRKLESARSQFVIPLEDALDPFRIEEHVEDGDYIAVYGSSHSAVLALKNLIELGKKVGIVNFYRSPLRYAFEQDGAVHFDNTGLKGEAAQWAHSNLEDPETLPANLVRVNISDRVAMDYDGLFTKTVHAVGFERRALDVGGVDLSGYNPQTGEIVRGIHGFGIAFPEHGQDPSGGFEYRVGAGKFMQHIRRALGELLARESA